MHVIAAKAVAFCWPPARVPGRPEPDRRERGGPARRRRGARRAIVSGGTDNHLMMVDVRPFGLTGARRSGCSRTWASPSTRTPSRSTRHPPNIASGIRLGTPAVTTRGFGPDEVREIGRLLVGALASGREPAAMASIAASVRALADGHLVPGLADE